MKHAIILQADVHHPTHSNVTLTIVPCLSYWCSFQLQLDVGYAGVEAEKTQDESSSLVVKAQELVHT